MKPLSNKITVPLLIIAIGFLVYYLIALITILTGIAQLVGSIYTLYISTFIIFLLVLGLVFSIRSRVSWEGKHIN